MTTGKGVEGEGGQHIVATISNDKGQTWSALIDIEPATGPEASWVAPLKTPGGRVYVFYTSNKANGKYLLWFHNHGGEAAHTSEWTDQRTGYYRHRNPVWAAGGVERNGLIHWSEPEILLYDDDPAVRMSYPDLIVRRLTSRRLARAAFPPGFPRRS